jgi:hypothetical protein
MVASVIKIDDNQFLPGYSSVHMTNKLTISNIFNLTIRINYKCLYTLKKKRATYEGGGRGGGRSRGGMYDIISFHCFLYIYIY